MATLIVTGPRPFANNWRIRILVDGRIAATVAGRWSAMIDLTPGRHQITAKRAFLSSQPVQIEAGPEGVHHLRAGSNIDRRGPLRFVFYSTMLVPWVALLLPSFVSGRLFSDTTEASWFTIFLSPLAVLPSLLPFALLALWRDRILFLEEIPTSDDDARRRSPPWSQLLHVRLTIRGLMVAVAILAILFGAGVEWMRFTRRGLYQAKASLHSQFEANFRNLQQSQERLTAEFEKKHHRASPIRQAMSKTAAMVDYHASMRRKYEEAAARRAFSVEPDPPAPPWP
jgi:hypothetical protein